MMRCLRFLILLMLCTIGSLLKGHAQQEVNVNPAKGLLSVNVPIHSFDFPGFSVPIGLSYAARGFKVNDPGLDFVGWDMYGGGTIKRIIRGFPDEQEVTLDNKKGWNYDAQWAIPLSFTPYDDNDENNCADEWNNFSWFSNNYNKDLQPDVFIVDAPGLNCRIMRDNQGVLKAIPAQDLTIEFNVVSLTNMDFIITTNSGIRYTFDLNSNATKRVNHYISLYDLFITEANHYGTPMDYIDCWYLSRIDVLNKGNDTHLDYEYYENIAQSNMEELKILVKDGNIDTAKESLLLEWERASNNRRRIKSMTSSFGSKAMFEGGNEIPAVIKIYDNLEPESPITKLVYFDSKVVGSFSAGTGRNFLAGLFIDGPGCNGKAYKFKYYGVHDTGTSADFPLNFNSKSTDAWGFLNGSPGQSPAPRVHVYPTLRATTGAYRPYEIPGYVGTHYVLPGNDKTPNENTIAYGSMSKITFPTGGSSSFEYECNSFLDQDANAEIKGGGLRIKAINQFDGLNTGTITRKEFLYKNDAGITSGMINIIPTYAISTPFYKNPISGQTRTYSDVLANFGLNTLNYWNYLTLRTKEDVYTGESSVSYTQVTTKETGNGKTKQVFSPSKSFWDTSSSILSYAGQTCNSQNSTFIIKGYNQYPFAPIESFTGGDLLEEYVYNEAGNLLKKSEYEYENYHTSPQRIYALKKDNIFGSIQFSKYYTTIVGNVLKKYKETIFDSNLAGNSLVTQTDFDNSAFNRKVRSKVVTNSDLTQIKTSYRYCGDFGPFQPTDPNHAFLDGLYAAYSRNFKDEVVEETTEIKPGGIGNFKLISAKANLLNGILSNGIKFPVLKEVRSIKSLEGLTDFSAMQITGSVPNRSLTIDSRYKTDQVYSDFSSSLMPATVTDKRAKRTLINDALLRVPLLEVSGAGIEDIAFYTADRMDRNTFVFSYPAGATYFNDPYFGGYVRFKPWPGNQLSVNYTRKPEIKFHRVSFFARTDTASQVKLMLDNALIATITIPVSDKFRFYEKIIDLSAIASGVFKVHSTSNIYLDNLLFSPADAQFVASNYHPSYGKTMEMNSSGVGACFDYAIGKISAERDLEGNITKAYFQNKYSEGSAIPYTAVISVINPTKVFAGRVTKFLGSGSCLPGTKYIWNFGDGTTLESYETSVSHMYNTAATYTVSLTLQHPEYTNHTSSKSVLVKPEPNIYREICASGVVRVNTCNTSIKYYNSCSLEIPGEIEAPNGTYFYAWASGCPSETYTYIWERSWDGISYSELGPFAVGDTLYMSIANYTNRNNYIRCKIISEDCDTVLYTDPVFIEANCSVN